MIRATCSSNIGPFNSFTGFHEAEGKEHSLILPFVFQFLHRIPRKGTEDSIRHKEQLSIPSPDSTIALAAADNTGSGNLSIPSPDSTRVTYVDIIEIGRYFQFLHRIPHKRYGCRRTR